MHIVRTESDLSAVSDHQLLALIRLRISETREYVDDFGELVLFVLVQAGDAVATVDCALGFPVLVNRFTGIPLGQPGFTPSWDVLQEHVGHFELVYVLGDDGSGVTMFVSKAEGASSELLAMFRQYGTSQTATGPESADPRTRESGHLI